MEHSRNKQVNKESVSFKLRGILSCVKEARAVQPAQGAHGVHTPALGHSEPMSLHYSSACVPVTLILLVMTQSHSHNF